MYIIGFLYILYIYIRAPIAMKGQRNQVTLSLIGAVSSFRPFAHYHHGRTWYLAGRHDVGEETESSTSFFFFF